MGNLLLCVVLTALAAEGPIETRFCQVAPVSIETAPFKRSPGQERAVVLVQGLSVHPFIDWNVNKPTRQFWQMPGSTLVTALAEKADVFAFAYGQESPVEEISHAPQLGDGVKELRRIGYKEVVLVGHSAGGLVARHFIEDHADSGVAKVVQVCTPNGGSAWGKLNAVVRKGQQPFLDSLTKESRKASLAKRAEKKIPENVEFVCLVGHMSVEVGTAGSLRLGKQELTWNLGAHARGDGLVTTDCQWTTDLQEQRIPVVWLETDHVSAVRSAESAKTIVKLVAEKQPRWSAEQVAEARRKLFGDGKQQSPFGVR